MIWLSSKRLRKRGKSKLVIYGANLFKLEHRLFILKAYTIQSLSQTNVQKCQSRQSLSEIVGYHRDLVVGQVAKEIDGKQISYIRCKLIQTGTPFFILKAYTCLLYTSPSPRDLSTSRMPSSA